MGWMGGRGWEVKPRNEGRKCSGIGFLSAGIGGHEQDFMRGFRLETTGGCGEEFGARCRNGRGSDLLVGQRVAARFEDGRILELSALGRSSAAPSARSGRQRVREVIAPRSAAAGRGTERRIAGRRHARPLLPDHRHPHGRFQRRLGRPRTAGTGRFVIKHRRWGGGSHWADERRWAVERSSTG